MTTTCDALVVGAGDVLGGRLVRSLLLQGLTVRAVDRRPVDGWAQVHVGADNHMSDLAVVTNAVAATSGATTVYDLAAVAPDASTVDRMTGALVDTHLLLAARDAGVDRFVLASSAVAAPATSVDRAGWRHALGERMARRFFEDCGLQTRVVRLGSVYGDVGDDTTVVGLVTRAVAAAVVTRRRSVTIPFRADAPASQLYVDDAVLGLQLVAHGTGCPGPHLLVDPAPVTVADVVDTVVRVADVDVDVTYAGTAETPHVVGDTGALRDAVQWEPDITLTAIAERVWAATESVVRRALDVPPSVTARRVRRDVALAAAHPTHPGRSPHHQVAGRHRYQNAG